jgi:RNA polymerase sigma-70 factor (ECF subfamily)
VTDADPSGDTAADLALARAAAAGDPQAIDALERGPLRQIGDFVARIDPAPAFAQEVRQAVREKLLVGPAPGQPGRLAEYAGTGPLGGWIRVVAVRVALDMKRAAGQDRPADADRMAQMVVDVALDPEMRLFRERHQGPFQQALGEALSSLSPRERNLLRLHFAEGATLEQLATSYQVHRATVARWLATARQVVMERVAGRLGESMGMSAGEVESVVRLLASQIDISLSRLR